MFRRPLIANGVMRFRQESSALRFHSKSGVKGE